MLIEQSEAISTNISKITRLKTRSDLISNPEEYAPVSTEFNEVFGGGEHPNVSWHWFVPIKVTFPHWAMDNIMGYDVSTATMTLDCTTPYQEPESAMMEGEDIAAASSLMAGVPPPSLDGEQEVVSSLVEVADVETGNNIQLNTEQRTIAANNRQQPMLEQKLLPRNDDGTTIMGCSDSDSVASGVKKRSAGSFIL